MSVSICVGHMLFVLFCMLKRLWAKDNVGMVSGALILRYVSRRDVKVARAIGARNEFDLVTFDRE